MYASDTVYNCCANVPTGGGRSVGIVRSRTKAMEFSLVYTVFSTTFCITQLDMWNYVTSIFLYALAYVVIRIFHRSVLYILCQLAFFGYPD
jgi:hypothetical protein